MLWWTGIVLTAAAVAVVLGLRGARRAIRHVKVERVLRVPAGQDVEDVRRVAQTVLTGALDTASGYRPSTLRARSQAISPDLRPFYLEGIGLAYSIRSAWDLRARWRGFLGFVSSVDPACPEIYFVGLGQWYEKRWRRRPAKVEALIAALPPAMRFWCANGYGFSQALFRETATVLAGWQPFSAGIQRAYCHGLGRALWKRYGETPELVFPLLDELPPHLRPEAYAGVGFVVAFQRIGDLPALFRWGPRVPEPVRSDYFLGAALGLWGRAVNDPAWTRQTVGRQAPGLTSSQSGWLEQALQVPAQAWGRLDATAADIHWQWQAALLGTLRPPVATEPVATEIERPLRPHPP